MIENQSQDPDARKGKKRKTRKVLRKLLLWSAIVLVLGATALVVFESSPLMPCSVNVDSSSWQSTPDFSVDKELPWLSFQYYDGSILWASDHKHIFKSRDLGQTWDYAGCLCPKEEGITTALKHYIGASNTHRLLMRPNGIGSMLVLKSGTVLVYCHPHIYRSEDDCKSFQVVHSLRQEPEWKRIFRHWCEDGLGNVYYGEYGVSRLADSRILRSTDDGKTWDIYYSFPKGGTPGGVRHIHTVQFDEYSKNVWCATGDGNDECHIGYFQLGGNFHSIGTGAQMWRVCSLVFTDRFVYWGADAPGGPCGVYRWSRQNGSVERVCELPGPVLFATRLADDTFVVSTEIEGVGSDHVEVWTSRDGANWQKVMQIPPYVEQNERKLGSLSFPLGEPVPKFVFNIRRLDDIERSAFWGHLTQ